MRETAIVKAAGLGQRRQRRHGSPTIVATGEASAHMTGAYPQLHHRRHVGRFGHRERMLDHVHHRRQFGPRVEQQQRGLHRISMRALLHHRCALAVVFADHHQHAAGHAWRRQIGQSIGRDIGADNGFPGDCAAHRVMDGCTQHGCCRCLVRASLDMYTQLGHQRFGLHHHIQQVRHRRALIAADIGHASLQQALGDREYALAVEGVPVAQPQLFYFVFE